MGDQQMRSSLEELEGFSFDEVPWTTPKPLADSRVAIVTTAGLRPAGGDGADWNPGDQAMPLLPASAEALVLAHFRPNFDRTGYQADINIALPIERLREMAADGEIGAVADLHYSFMGATDPEKMEATAHELARHLIADKVDAVLLVPI